MSATAIPLTVGSYNVHNIYDTKDDPRYRDEIATPEQYALRLSKAASAIVQMGTPDVLGLEEVENNRVVMDLLKQGALKDAGYKAKFVQGNDFFQHNDAILYKDSKVTLDTLTAVNPPQILNDGQGAINPRLLFTTPPAVANFRLKGAQQAAEGVSKLTFIVNHMKSKLGGSKFDTRRNLQGEFIGKLVDEHLTANPDAPVIVTGDFNAGDDDSQFVKIMKRADGSDRMFDTADLLPAGQRWSYTYHNQNSLLDHVLITTAHRALATNAAIPHFSTRPDLAKVKAPDSGDGASDHDPVLATLNV